MRVCFYLNNQYNVDIDYSCPEKGNPGIGGTQYMVWTVSYYLSILYKNIEVILLANIIERLPENIKSYKCEDLKDSMKIAKELNVDIFIFENVSEQIYGDKSIYNIIDELKLTSIMWGHIYENTNSLRYAADCEYLKRYVCVGKEQYDRLMDHDIFKKSTFIYNALDFSIYDKYANINKNKENIICYMGALNPIKGFHKLAEIWSEIEDRVPNVKLHIIGGGNLYSSNKKLGKYGVADESYENIIMKNITDVNGNIKGNIKFFGVLKGEEKLRVMSHAKIGVANPTGLGETFCIVAVEFEALGVPVVTAKKNGLLDTVYHKKTGLLTNKSKRMVDDIVYLLNDDINNEMSQNAVRFVRKKFDIHEICKQWECTLNDVMENKPAIPHLKMQNNTYDLKWLRRINRNIKKIKIFDRNLSVLEYRINLGKGIRALLRKLM